MHEAGGVALLARELLEAAAAAHRLGPQRRRALARQIASAVEERPGQEVVVPLEQPLKPTGGLRVLNGNLAPDGAIAKLAGHERLVHRGPARVFDPEEACFAAVKARSIVPGDVVVIRYEGPAGGPGMREMLHVTAAIVGEGLGLGRARHRRPLLRRDPRVHGRPRHPEAFHGGPLAAVEDGDVVVLDVAGPRAARRAVGRRARAPAWTRGCRRRRATRPACSRSTRRLVSSASEGAVTRP